MVKIKYVKMSFDDKKPYTPPNDHTVFFSQVACTTEPKNLVGSKNKWGMFVTTLGLLMVIVYRLRLRRIENELKIEEKIMDYSLSSIDDYTIECKIDSDFYHEVIKITEDA